MMKKENNYIKRHIDSELIRWVKSKNHKPLLLRGARQVGKSSSVRNLAKLFPHFLEINFEKDADARQIFAGGNLSPQRLCSQLSAIYNIPVVPGKTLLFFDEIQSCLPAISSLRFFYEDYPKLHVIAAGSLLEFALEVLPSFGVGRIRTLFMYPFSFAEFLGACHYDLLLEAIGEGSVENPLHDNLHRKALEHLREFLIVGGMPEIVAIYASCKDLRQCQQALDDLVGSLRNDFAKYKQRIPPLQISTVFDMVSEQIGRKFVFSKSGQAYSHYQLKQALEMLRMAGLIIPVVHTAATGIPLGAQVNPKKQKMLLLDTGILQRVQDLQLSNLLLSNDFNLVNKGNIAELFVGLELLKAYSSNWSPRLYYWQREKPNSHAEVDYIIQRNEEIIPIEVKSGTSGAMQSLHLFMKEKSIACGIRTSLENFAQYSSIKVIPLYAISSVLK
jgi:predicted AAA+ superfamily ATPase